MSNANTTTSSNDNNSSSDAGKADGGFGKYPPFYIGDRAVGPDHPTYFIAELSCNHGQDYEMAEKLVRAAAEAGADAIKLQTLSPETITIDCDNDYFMVKNTGLWDGRTLYDLYQEAYTPWEWHKPLKELANSLGCDLFTSPFAVEAVDFLEKEIDPPVYKVASFESTDHQLLRRIARTGKPIIMSTGMATLADIDESVRVLRAAGNTQLCVLKCTSAYPAKPEDANLITMNTIANTFNTTPGLSDHTLGVAVPVAAVTMGARIVEKHFTLDRSIPGPDSSFSLEPQEFKEMVDTVRIVEKSIGKVTFGGSGKKEKSNKAFRRSLFVVQDVKAGEPFTRENVKSIRPSFGMHTEHFPDVLGRVASRDVERGTPMAWNLIDSDESQLEVHQATADDKAHLETLSLASSSLDEVLDADNSEQVAFVGLTAEGKLVGAVHAVVGDAAAELTWAFDEAYTEAGNKLAQRLVLLAGNKLDMPINVTATSDADKALAAALGMVDDGNDVYGRHY